MIPSFNPASGILCWGTVQVGRVQAGGVACFNPARGFLCWGTRPPGAPSHAASWVSTPQAGFFVGDPGLVVAADPDDGFQSRKRDSLLGNPDEQQALADFDKVSIPQAGFF